MAGPFLLSRNGVVIVAPPQRVFDYLADMTRHGEWNPEPDFQVTARPDAPLRVGSVYRRERTGEMQGPLILRGGMGESRVTVVKTTAITTYQPHTALVFVTRNSYNGLLHSAETLSFTFRPQPDGTPESAPEGTMVTMVSEVEAMVPSAFIGPVYAIRMVRAAFQRLLGQRFSRRFPNMAVGPHLARIKETLESP